MVVDANGTSILAVREVAGEDQLLLITPQSGVTTARGLVRVGAATPTDISALALGANGEVFAVNNDTSDPGNLKLIEINAVSPATSVEIDDLDDDLAGLASDDGGILYSIFNGAGNNRLLKSLDADNPVPLDNLIDRLGDGTPVAPDYVGLAVTGDLRGFAVADNGAGGFDLYEAIGGDDGVASGIDGVNFLGTLTSGGLNLLNVQAVESDPSSFGGAAVINVIASLTPGGPMGLFAIDPDAGTEAQPRVIMRNGVIDFDQACFTHLGIQAE